MDAVEGVDAKNVLLQSPSFADREREACARLLAKPNPDTLVGVTTAETPDEWLSSRLESSTVTPDHVQLVCVGGQTRSGAPATESAPVETATVNDPGNLTELGTALSDRLANGQSGQVLLCVDSLTTLLHHSDTSTVFQFLHVLTDLVTTNAVEAHYHLDPSAHDEQAVATVKMLVDAVVTVSGYSVEVETR